MKEYNQMTRKELIEIIVDDQVKRNICSLESKPHIVKRMLSDNLGIYASKKYLINICENIGKEK